jgi:hypothetical protein
MPRKQTRQPSRKRLWFNVVEFDKETGRPLWRNKKSKLENTPPACIIDPKFTALLDKLRKETENAARNIGATSSPPYSPVWRISKYNLNPRARPEVENSCSLQSNSFSKSRYENDESSPELVMQFQHFSPLAESESLDSLNMEQQKRQIQDLLKMKSVQASSTFQDEQGHQNMRRDNSIKRDVQCGMTSNYTLPSDWGMNNTVRLHHLDLENKNSAYDNSQNYGLTVNQQVALTIY